MTQLATVITGASSGIGLELAHLFAPEHQHLVLVARRREPMDALAKELQSRHGAPTVAKEVVERRPHVRSR